MITYSMNKNEIINEFKKADDKIRDQVDRVHDRLYNKAKIESRKTGKNIIYLGVFKQTVLGTKYYTIMSMSFPEGTRDIYKAGILSSTYIFLNSDTGKKVVYTIYLDQNKISNEKYSTIVEYTPHFFRRYYERTRKEEVPEKLSFEKLVEIYFKEAGGNIIYTHEVNKVYRDYPGHMVLGKVVGGLTLGYYDEIREIHCIKTYVSEDMFFQNQLEEYGDDSEVGELVKVIDSLLMNGETLEL